MSIKSVAALLVCALSSVQISNDADVTAVRCAHYEVLCRQYASAVADSQAGEPESHVCCQFLPKFMALAEENPSDEAALKCCQWIVMHCGPTMKTEPALYEADSAAWDLIRNHQTASKQLSLMCLIAAQQPSPAREDFLRSLPQDYRQTVEVHGHAYLALAELLAKKHEAPIDRIHPTASEEWQAYTRAVDRERVHAECRELLMHVIAHYPEVSLASATDDSRSAALGKRATNGLLQLARAQTDDQPSQPGDGYLKSSRLLPITKDAKSFIPMR